MLLEEIGLIVWKFMILTITHGLHYSTSDGKVAGNVAGLLKK